GLNVLTLVDVDTLELSLLEVNAELDDGVDTEELTYGVLLVWLEELAIDVDGAGLLVDGDGDETEVVTGLNVLTLVDVDTLELSLLEVNAELDEGVDTEELTYGVLLVWLEELAIDVDGAGLLVDGDGDETEVVTGLNVLTLVDVDTLELSLIEVNAELDEGVDTEELTYGVLLTWLEELAIDVDGTGLLVDGDGDETEVVTGLNVLTLVDVDTLELSLIEVNAELDDGVDTEELTYGVLLVWLDELAIDVDGAGLLVDGDGDETEVVTGLNVLTLVDVDTLELSLLEVNAELDDGVDTEELTYGVLLVLLDELAIDVDGAGLLVDGDGDETEVVTGLNVLTLVDVETLELSLLEVNAELDEGVDTEELTYGLDVLTT
uniref:Uncharacterized protein n=1 Tax=Clytia hemisphaerica TaxID=252671 RepID=A0A7M5V2M3_9CNID